MALAVARMGQVEHAMGDLLTAEGHIRQAIDLRRKAGDRQGMVASYLDLGNLEKDLGRAEGALAILDEGKKLADDMGECLFSCGLAIAIGDCWLTLERPAEAQRHFQEARDTAQRFGAKQLACEAMRGLAEVRLARGDVLGARDDASFAYQSAHKWGATTLAGASLRVAATAVGLGAPGEVELGGAREMFDRAVEILSNGCAELELGRTLEAYADFEVRSGRKAVASALRRQVALIRDNSRTLGTTHRLGRSLSLPPPSSTGERRGDLS